MKKSVLLAMADHIEKNVAERDFNMGIWFCGAVGCAVGHCEHLIPGLRLERPFAHSWMRPVFTSGATQMSAVAQALDIPQEDADRIFGDSDYRQEGDADVPVTRAEVVARIREYVG